MKRRSKVSGGRAKAQGRDAAKLTYRTASKGATRHPPSAAGEHTEVVARLTHELNEALEQQSVTSELLGIISSGAAELEPIFRAILEKATGLCDAEIGNIYRWDGDALYLVAAHNAPPAFEELRRRSPFRPKADTPIGRMIATKKVAHVADLRKQRGYIEKTDNDLIAGIELSGMRTFLSVPMLKDGELLGALSIYRLHQRKRPRRRGGRGELALGCRHRGRTSRQMLNETGREPTPEELAEELRMPVAKVRMTLKIAKEPASLETPIGDEGDSRLGDLIEDQNTILPIDAAIQSNLRDITSRVLASLTPREERIVRMRFGIGINSDHTLEQVGQQFSVTRERIRQIEAKALRKLKHPSRSSMLRSFLK